MKSLVVILSLIFSTASFAHKGKYSNNCDEVKDQVRRDNPDWDALEFTGRCNYKLSPQARFQAGRDLLEYQKTNPRCTKEVVIGSADVDNDNAIDYTTYVGWWGCKDWPLTKK